jgi:hypothetical protein
MNSKTMLLSLAPWALFTVIAGHAGADYVGYAALVATVVAIGVAVKNGLRHAKLIDLTGITTFTAITVIGFVGTHGIRQDVVDYGRGACALVLAIVMLGSLLFVPFSEQYARESVPQPYWSSPVFHSMNRRISAAFGLAILVMSGSHFLSGYLEATSGLPTRTNLILNWVIPIALVLGAMKYTARITAPDTESASAAPSNQAGTRA